MKDALYFDEESKLLQSEIPQSNMCVIKLSFSLDFDIGQSYVTSKIEDRDGNIRKLNIQSGTRGIKLQSDLIRLKNKETELPTHVYVRTTLRDGRTLVRKLPVIETSDWLLIFEEDLCILAVKDQYDEIEILG
ncbi:MAG: hypothetical protein P0116_05565 [Candidatus Nitrosocosmicus sp.]|nr:hypothetical protein [Candidatus Nitrosocosmicus sp.]